MKRVIVQSVERDRRCGRVVQSGVRAQGTLDHEVSGDSDRLAEQCIFCRLHRVTYSVDSGKIVCPIGCNEQNRAWGTAIIAGETKHPIQFRLGPHRIRNACVAGVRRLVEDQRTLGSIRFALVVGFRASYEEDVKVSGTRQISSASSEMQRVHVSNGAALILTSVRWEHSHADSVGAHERERGINTENGIVLKSRVKRTGLVIENVSGRTRGNRSGIVRYTLEFASDEYAVAQHARVQVSGGP